MSSQDYPFADPPSSASDPNNPAQPAQSDNPDLMGQWSTALSDPTVRSSLLQFGISMLQPPSFGDSFGSQFGRAVGSAGEAASSRETEEQKRQDTSSKTTLREARAGAAESRAREAGANLDVKKGMLQVQQDRLGVSQILQGQRRHRDAMNSYNKYVQLLPPDQRFGGKYDDFSTWATKNGYGDVASGPPGTTVAPGGGSASINVDQERQLAQGAIAARPDRAEAIRARFKERTGQDPDF